MVGSARLSGVDRGSATRHANIWADIVVGGRATVTRRQSGSDVCVINSVKTLRSQ